ncbi:MAG TPA: transketolase C-terminal domain-containing protein [Candidatus Acidoferrum sp.]|nr:transketolase C-terminal domain-containing protein [Candidatus Acidoferrum sp.]
MRNTFADTLYEAGQNDKRVAIVVADISPAGSMQKFRDEFPERFVNTGVAEQIMIGLCAGMALRGLRPFAYTIATFTFYRPFEFVRDDLCYQNLPVTIVGIGGGLAYSTLGGTHHAQEDVVLAAALPNMTVLAPCDPAETRQATLWCTTQERGPVYLRLGKAGEPDLTSRSAEPFVFGTLRYLQRGSDVCILSYGPILKLAADLARRFEARGESVSLVSAHTLKPLDTDGVVAALQSHRRVVVIEEAAPYALGLRVKALAWEAKASCRLDTFALQDQFIHSYGAPAELLAAHGLELGAIAARLGLA